MKKSMLALCVAGALGAQFMPSSMPYHREIATKKCLNCRKEHTHNNSFSSAECCSEWKENKNNSHQDEFTKVKDSKNATIK